MKLAAMNLSSLRATAEVLFWRHGVLPVIAAVALLAGVFAAVWLAPQQYSALTDARAELTRMERERDEKGAAQATLLPASTVFQQTLADQQKSNEVIRRIFELASEQGVTVSQADYRRSPDAPGGFSQLQIALPVKGTYGQIKRYSLHLLAEVPALSIDQMTLKREAPNSTQVEGQLLLSLWQKSSTRAASPAQAEAQ